jgi:hypothetical protein
VSHGAQCPASVQAWPSPSLCVPLGRSGETCKEDQLRMGHKPMPSWEGTQADGHSSSWLAGQLVLMSLPGLVSKTPGSSMRAGTQPSRLHAPARPRLCSGDQHLSRAETPKSILRILFLPARDPNLRSAPPPGKPLFERCVTPGSPSLRSVSSSRWANVFLPL